MARGAGRSTVRGVPESQTRLSTHAHVLMGHFKILSPKRDLNVQFFSSPVSPGMLRELIGGWRGWRGLPPCPVPEAADSLLPSRL